MVMWRIHGEAGDEWARANIANVLVLRVLATVVARNDYELAYSVVVSSITGDELHRETRPTFGEAQAAAIEAARGLARQILNELE